MSEFPPLIYVDLIEEERLAFAQWTRETFGPNGTDLLSDKDLDDSYRAYRLAFQPWRILIRSGDNYKSLFRSTERYFNEADAKHAAELAFGSGSNIYLRQAEKGNRVLRLATS